MDWYIVDDGEAAGPFKESEVRRWLGSGKLSPETHATHEGVNEWKPLSELLPDDETAENLPPAFSPEEPMSFPVESVEVDSTESPGKTNADQPDLRRYQPAQEERIRSWAWTVVGAMYLAAFFWPTELSDGMGVVNFQFAWAMKNLSWSAIPLMVWPAVAGLGAIGTGWLLRGRWRAFFGGILCVSPLVLVFLVGGDGFVKIVEALGTLEGVDINDRESIDQAAEKGKHFMSGILGVFAAMALGMVLIVGGALSVYLMLLLTPSTVRHLRPNSSGAYYFGLVGGVILFIFQLVLLILSLLSFMGSVLFGLGQVLAMGMQMAAVIIGFLNAPSRPPKESTRRALWSAGLGFGGLIVYLLCLLVVPLIEGEVQAVLGMYVFKAFLGFTAAALIFPLVVIDLWLGRAQTTLQND
ncbi:MAG TPA: hypothetical protein DEQ62_05225 [Verrucomicrobiales bacterium]|nr:hypothetical protein [Verrucomicrobiales bacterium]|tara:strand:+ start:736 stop:1968 length:1233 start_codon:yes stop_codon:yes gene_type:complete